MTEQDPLGPTAGLASRRRFRIASVLAGGVGYGFPGRSWSGLRWGSGYERAREWGTRFEPRMNWKGRMGGAR